MYEIMKLYNDHPVRIAERDGNPWFVAKDVCEVLEIVDLAEKTATFLSASNRSQLLQNGSLLQFNGKVRRRMVLRLPPKTAFR